MSNKRKEGKLLYPSNVFNDKLFKVKNSINLQQNFNNMSGNCSCNNNIHEQIMHIASIINYYENIFNNGKFYYLQLPYLIKKLYERYCKLNAFKNNDDDDNSIDINNIVIAIKNYILNRDNHYDKINIIDNVDITFLIKYIIYPNDNNLVKNYYNFIYNNNVILKHLCSNIFDNKEIQIRINEVDLINNLIDQNFTTDNKD